MAVAKNTLCQSNLGSFLMLWGERVKLHRSITQKILYMKTLFLDHLCLKHKKDVTALPTCGHLLHSKLWKELENGSECEELEKTSTAISLHFTERSHLLPHPFFYCEHTFVLLLLLQCKCRHTGLVPCRVLSCVNVILTIRWCVLMSVFGPLLDALLDLFEQDLWVGLVEISSHWAVL